MTRYVEKPPHADRERVRHLTEDAVSRAAAGSTVDDLLANGRRPVPALADVVAAYGRAERDRVCRESDAAAADPRSFTDRGLGRSALYGFHYLTWTVPLLERHLLTGDQEWLDRWAGVFNRWYDSRDRVRGDWPGLDVVWYTLGVGARTPVLIDALDTGGAALSRETRVRLLASVLGGARWLADEHDAFRQGNWQVVGACTLLCVGALFPEFTEAPAWVAIARARITEHLDRDVHPDGGHHERSPGYHQLCLEFLHRAALHAERYLGWSLGADERMVAMADWLAAMATPEGWVPPFQDSRHVAAGPALLRAHRWAPKPAYAALASATMSGEELAVARAGLPDAASVSVSGEPAGLGAWLPGSRYFVSRSGRAAGDLYAAVNCGPRVSHELESHSHRACLDLVLWGHGQPLAWEAGGPDSYDDPAYHDWFQSPAAHGTVVFDDREPDLTEGATVDSVVLAPDADVLDAHYDGWGPRHRRTFVAVRPADGLPGYWLIRDDVGAHGWRWMLHGRSAWLCRGDKHFSAEAPGLAVHVPGEWTARTSVGRTSYPAAGGPRWGELHGLALRPRGRSLTAVLVPFAESPHEVTVSESDGVVRVEWGGTVDELGPGYWRRSPGQARVSGAVRTGRPGAVLFGQSGQ